MALDVDEGEFPAALRTDVIDELGACKRKHVFVDAVFATDSNAAVLVEADLDEIWVIWTVDVRGQWRDGWANNYFRLLEQAAASAYRRERQVICDAGFTPANTVDAGAPRPPRILYEIAGDVPHHYLFGFTRGGVCRAVDQGAADAWAYLDRASGSVGSAGAPTECYDLRWTETMRGQLVVGADVFRRSSATTGGIDVEFTVRGTIADLDTFIDDDEHQVKLTGHVSSELIGGRRPHRRGELRLFRPTTSTAVTELAYLLEFSDASGAHSSSTRVKTVRDDRGVDLWRDTSTIDAVLRNVSAAPSERGPTAALPAVACASRCSDSWALPDDACRRQRQACGCRLSATNRAAAWCCEPDSCPGSFGDWRAPTATRSRSTRRRSR